jgi:ketosteroid isomerase-like protein
METDDSRDRNFLDPRIVEALPKRFLRSLPPAIRMPRPVRAAALTLLVCIGFAPKLASQPRGTAAASLRRDIELADSAMFAAYNAQDRETLGRYFAHDLEFFHDTGGLLTWSQALEGRTSTFARTPDMRRTLVGPIEVYPIRDYGAIQVGVHQFCHRENGRQECGTFKFTHIWRRTANGWQITRAVSYDH